MTTLPNLLTLGRIAAIPLMLATFYWDTPVTRWAACALFALAGITDFFDGYLARRFNQVSAIGRFLDPIADKLLVSSLLLFLAAFERIDTLSLIPAVVILCREILVSGLREYLAELRVGMPVTPLAKWKTATQMIALPVLIVGDPGLPGHAITLIGEILLCVAAILTLMTGYGYLTAGIRFMREADKHRS
jgi:cardiolipin synthase